ncbi:unnamed protein product [Effrenium voratum]|uniref:Uncharacterized protein n=1 Tax=Effrenium voratum TaxID=2562239 RepID=A0AA36HL95_9DINO|nr:unnamed protein product [Effrenium voratum]
MSSCKDPPIGGNEMAGLRAFLRSRCGSLKAAFAELDCHNVGQLTSDDFVKGLQRFGYAEDASTIFRSIDAAKSGTVTMKSFMSCLGDRMVEAIDADRRSMVKPLARSASEDVRKSARIPKIGAPNLLTSVALGGALKSGSALRSSTPDDAGLMRTSPHMPAADADLLFARISKVEEQVAAQQRLRSETEQKLTQHLNSLVLVGVSMSEQLDVIREQLAEERAQRQVDVTGLRASVEALRSLALRSVQENLEECVKSEVDKSIGEVRGTLGQSGKSPELQQKLDVLSKATETRLAELESSVRHVHRQPSCQTIEDGHHREQHREQCEQHRDALLQASLRLREAEVRLREQNLEMRERAVKMQQDGPMQPPHTLGRGCERSASPPQLQGHCSCAAVTSPPLPPGHPMRQSCTSTPLNRGMSRPAMVSSPMQRGADPRSPASPVMEGRPIDSRWAVNAQMRGGMHTPSPVHSHVPAVQQKRM